MDPVTLVVTALAAGLTAGVSEAAKTSIKDLYERLKQTIVVRSPEKAKTADIITVLEQSPKLEQTKEQLDLALREGNVKIGKDLVDLALQILKTTDPKGTKAGKYSVSIENSQGVVVGDRSSISMSFSTPRKKS